MFFVVKFIYLNIIYHYINIPLAQHLKTDIATMKQALLTN